MRLQLLKEQVVKEMRNVKKTAFVGLPGCMRRLGSLIAGWVDVTITPQMKGWPA